MMNDHTKKFVVKTILLNNRLDAYKGYLRYAAENGYRIISLEDFYRLPDRRTEKHFVLRHDVDWPGRNIRKMFEAERECGVTSTYYFRFSTIDKQLIRDMKDAGFHVGFHFETIADYIQETGCTDKNAIDLELMRERFAQDVKRFEEICGFKIDSCCSHGHPLNRQLGISNNTITENQDMSRYGLLFEAYEADLYAGDVDCHIMDRSIRTNYGFAYNDNPCSAIDTGFQNIIFLSHPHNWYSGIKQYIRDIRLFVSGKFTWSTSREFKRIAD